MGLPGGRGEAGGRRAGSRASLAPSPGRDAQMHRDTPTHTLTLYSYKTISWCGMAWTMASQRLLGPENHLAHLIKTSFRPHLTTPRWD